MRVPPGGSTGRARSVPGLGRLNHSPANATTTAGVVACFRLVRCDGGRRSALGNRCRSAETGAILESSDPGCGPWCATGHSREAGACSESPRSVNGSDEEQAESQLEVGDGAVGVWEGGLEVR